MEVIIEPDSDAVARRAADAVTALLERTPEAVLGLATGSSPVPTYRELIRRHRSGAISFAAATAFLLDEYVGLPADHPAAYRTFIRDEFVDHIDLPAGSLHGPDGTADDLLAATDTYERQIADAGGVDLQILGIGSDGHVAFNEPTSSLGSRTRLKTLMDETRSDNARFFDDVDQVPHHVLTQGIATILEARHIVMIATGSGKAEPISRMVEGPISAMVPASALQLHPHVTVVVDEEAAADLALEGYYRAVFANKPEFQPL